MSNSDKISEKKYKKLAKEMEMILDNIPGLVFYKDTENNFIRVNKYFADSHKLNKKELESKSCFDLYSKEQAQAYWDDDLKVINSGKPKLNILEPWEIESGVRWVSTNKIPFFDDKGKCIGIIGFSKDVTEEIKAERKLRASEEKLRRITSNAKDAIIQIDDRGQISYWNKAAEKIFGYSENEVLGKDLHTLIAPKRYHKSFLKGMELFRKTGNGPVVGKTLEIEGIRRDGTEFPVELSISSVSINENWNALAFIRDITERKQAEEKYVVIFEHSPIAIELYDPDGILIKVNKACLDLFGIVDIKDLEKFKLFDDPNIPEKEKKILKGGKTIRYEGEFDFDKVKQLNLYKTTKLGVIHLDVVITPLYIRDKHEISNYLVQIQDITERKLAEQKLEEYSRNLEDIVEQRTLSLQKEMEESQLYLDIAGVMLLVINADGTVKHINKKGCKILGYAEEQIIGKNWFDIFIPKENKDEIKSVFRKLMAGEIEPVEYYENSILSKNGIEKIIAWHNNVLKDEQGNIVGTLSSGEDITERKKAEQKLKENSEFIQNVFNAIQHGLSVLDLDLNIVKVNPYMTEMYGPIDQILNKKCYDVYQKRSSPCPWCPSIKTIETGQLNTSIVPYPTSENPTGWIELTTYPLKNSEGIVEGIIESLKDITESKKMMEELRIKDIVFNASLSAQSTADINGIIDHVNPAFLELWGYKSNEEAIGNSVGSFFENPDDAIPVLKALTETGKWEGEFLAKRNDGSTFISQGFATTIYNEQGEQIGFQSANLDVTKHREADKKLEESEKKYRTLYESNLDGITHVDMEGNFIDANKTLLDMIGYTMEDLKGKTFHELTPQKYSEVDENSVNQIMTIGYCDEYEKEFIRKDGTHFPINLKGWLERDDKGEPIGLWGIIRDITEHKNAEILIQESVENFMDIVNNSPDGFIIADEKGRHLFANQRVADITGYGIEELVSMTGWELTRPEDKKELKEMMKKVLRRETHNMPYERILLRKDGSEIFTEFRTALTKWKGKISPMAVIRDITEQKRIEKELLSTLENLKSVNIELEKFAYVASHDLQEPLRMIVSFIQLLEKRYKDKLDEDADEFIAFIVDGAKRMQSLISDLLTYSRIGRIVEPFRSIDINVVIDSVINNLKKSIVEIDAKITYDPLPTLTGNEIELMQLLQNLISNAIKFHKDERPPVVHISAKLLKNQWIFSIRDNGIGIDSQYFDRIFIIFQRLHKKDEFGGTGIGLAICKKIIEHHRGKIWVESELGKGSTFYFSIPNTEVRK